MLHRLMMLLRLLLLLGMWRLVVVMICRLLCGRCLLNGRYWSRSWCWLLILVRRLLLLRWMMRLLLRRWMMLLLLLWCMKRLLLRWRMMLLLLL